MRADNPRTVRQRNQFFCAIKCKPVNPPSHRCTVTTEHSGGGDYTVPTVQYQHGSQPAGVIFAMSFIWIVFCIRRRSPGDIGAMLGIAQSG